MIKKAQNLAEIKSKTHKNNEEQSENDDQVKNMRQKTPETEGCKSENNVEEPDRVVVLTEEVTEAPVRRSSRVRKTTKR